MFLDLIVAHGGDRIDGVLLTINDARLQRRERGFRAEHVVLGGCGAGGILGCYCCIGGAAVASRSGAGGRLAASNSGNAGGSGRDGRTERRNGFHRFQTSSGAFEEQQMLKQTTSMC